MTHHERPPWLSQESWEEQERAFREATREVWWALAGVAACVLGYGALMTWLLRR